MKAFAVLLLGAGFVLAADKAEDDAKKEVAKLKGTWTPTSLRWNGKDLPTDGKYKFKFVFQDDQATIEGSNAVKKEYGKITFKLDPTTDPKIVDMTISAGVQKDAVIEGIYQLKDDELTICAKVLGNERPAQFESAEGSSVVLIVLKREKP
jgi:uncharacterized protein (TIGR03067 family)